MMNITGKQWFGISGVILNVAMGSAALYTKVWGSDVSQVIILMLSSLNTAVSGISIVLGSQGSIVREVADMPGVNPITINAQANQTLAQVALDPSVNKVSASPEIITEIINTARGGTP